MVLFDLYGAYYDALYSDKDYSAETDYIVKTFKSNGLKDGEILEFGCGTGRHGRLLGKSGYLVHGVDLSQQMIDLAESSDQFSCEQGDIRTVSFGKKFDAVVSFFHVMSYQVSNTDVNAVFSNASKHLKKGGLFIFDFWYQPAVLSQIPENRLKKMSMGDVTISRVAEPMMFPNENRVDVNYTIFVADVKQNKFGEISECHSMRYFSLPEIDLFCKINGFKRIQAEEFESGKAPSTDTWGVCVILEKL